jgi:hypothetical protein
MKLSEIKDKTIKQYLLEHFAGKMLYIPVCAKKKKRSRLTVAKILRSYHWSDEEICKTIKVFPCELRKMDKESRDN